MAAVIIMWGCEGMGVDVADGLGGCVRMRCFMEPSLPLGTLNVLAAGRGGGGGGARGAGDPAGGEYAEGESAGGGIREAYGE